MTTIQFPALNLSVEQLSFLRFSARAAFPELEAIRSNPQNLQNLQDAPQTRVLLAQTGQLMQGIEQIPQTSYTQYRLFQRNGDRKTYEGPYFLKRARLAAAALRLFLGQQALKDMVQDYIWSICEEHNWVLPAHEIDIIDLFSAETAFLLAETLLLLGDMLDEEVRHQVYLEVERRVFEPYLRFHQLHNWYRGDSNWNGVCNSSIAATFLLLEPEPQRVERGLHVALEGLDVFLRTAFMEDGSSNEGVAYWSYGLLHVIALAEMLYAQSDGVINLLATPRLQKIAAFPAKVQMAANHFATFSDCDESVSFHPGTITRLLERSGEQSLRNLLLAPAAFERDWRLSTLLRDLLWWDGSWQKELQPLTDTWLREGGIARLIGLASSQPAMVVCAKAGHNDENHNQNDIGSFILFASGEEFLTDPGRGLYTRDYFGPKRYENIFTNSYGHSVPRIDGQLQGTGRSFFGSLQVEDATASAPEKRVLINFASAYPCPDLQLATREIVLTDDPIIWLTDRFRFAAGQPHAVEEALLTWRDCSVQGATASIIGEQHTLLLSIEEPQECEFRLERLEEQCQANRKAGLLKRLSFTVKGEKETAVRVKLELRNQH